MNNLTTLINKIINFFILNKEIIITLGSFLSGLGSLFALCSLIKSKKEYNETKRARIFPYFYHDHYESHYFLNLVNITENISPLFTVEVFDKNKVFTKIDNFIKKKSGNNIENKKIAYEINEKIKHYANKNGEFSLMGGKEEKIYLFDHKEFGKNFDCQKLKIKIKHYDKQNHFIFFKKCRYKENYNNLTTKNKFLKFF